ncbi:MAG: RNA polymerase sigma factor [Bacteroidota bacterium]
MAEHLSDKELLEIIHDKDRSSYGFNLLVRKYQQKAYWHVRRIVIDHDDANDVVQNTFIKVWGNIANFRQESELFTWIYRIATNEALGFLRKKRTKFFIPIVNIEHQLSNKLESDPHFSANEIEMKFQKALLTLPEKQRIVFNMKYFDELKYEEISAVLGTSVGALKANYHHAVKKIENFLKDH